ncbi:Scr1 family TA system antitoxin-like transcriptional regulator [Microbispora sp. NBC_01389]|uniref:Scr1 family TA system antitoxin-like transcriptional regulator n=1 Tax=Microbispora sp. NBC_01389 TaxID=2903584 RepID=UPI00324EE73C
MSRPVSFRRAGEQLAHLASVAGPRVSVQIVPPGRVRSGLLAGFTIATLEVAHLETAVRGLTTSNREDVAAAAKVFDAIRVEALPLHMSTDLLKRVMEERWT